MGGIAGIVRFDGGTPDAAIVERMLDTMAHRGPDGRSILVDGSAAFGHLRFRDREGVEDATLPCRIDDGVMTTDCRLDARPPGNRPDGEIVRDRLRTEGTGAISSLLGDFALAWWNGRALTLARDYVGYRPLFWTRIRGAVAFASEVWPLLHEVVPQAPDNRRWLVDRQYAIFAEAPDKSAFHSISRARPAHITTIGAKGVSSHRYWNPATFARRKDMTLQQAADSIRGVFISAVEDRIDGVSSPACLLSGGLDSGSVVGLMAHRKPVDAYSMRFPTIPECDEGRFLTPFRNLPNLNIHDVDIEGCGPTWGLSLRTWAGGGFPVLYHNTYLLGLMQLVAGRHRVVLDGMEGDASIGVLPQRPAGAPVRARLVRGLPAAAGAAREILQGRPFSRSGWQFGPIARADRFLLLRQLGKALMRGRRSEHMNWQQRPFVGALIPSALEYVDSWCSFFGVQHRSPFYDRRVVETSLEVPDDLRRGSGMDRYFFRVGMRGFVPDACLARAGKMSLQPAYNRRTPGTAILGDAMRESHRRLRTDKVVPPAVQARALPASR